MPGTGQESRSVTRPPAPSVIVMTSTTSSTSSVSLSLVVLETSDPEASGRVVAALGVGDRIRVRASSTPADGFRGFSLSLLVSQPASVDLLLGEALAAGARELKPAARSLWGYGGVVEGPDGTIWKVATSAKKNRGPATKHVDDLVLLLGVEDVVASKRCYAEHGFTVGKSFGRSYAEFETPAGSVKLALYRRRALAKDVGVSAESSGPHRLVLGGAGSFVDPDGFTWDPAA